MVTKRDNTPDHFVSQFHLEDPIEEVPDLWMPTYDNVTFLSRDDEVTIAGWFIPADEETENVVIVVHGVNGCKADSTQLIPASMLHQNGFDVLMIDLRNHGDSEVTNGRMSAGNTEYNDVLGAFDYLQERGFTPENIGLAGISFGGGTAAIAFGEEPNMAALWLDSPFGNIEEVVEFELQRNGFPTFFRTAAIQLAQLNGVPMTVRNPDEEIQRNNARPIMIVHGTDDGRVPFRFGQQLYENAGANAEFMPFEGMDHVQAMYAQPEVYEAALIGFFTQALGND
jgi:dipeptidyl aminopeptidase/acylaminoacyl peptidase